MQWLLGNSGNAEVWVAKFSKVIFFPLYEGTLILGGRYCSIGSSKLIKPRLTISAKRIVVNTLVIDPIAKIVSLSTVTGFSLDVLP